MSLRDGEVDMYRAIGSQRITGTFHEMLLSRRTRSVGIQVKLEQTLGQLAVVQSFTAQQSAYDVLIAVVAIGQLLRSSPVETAAGGIELIVESEGSQVGEEDLLHIGLRLIVRRVDEGKERLKHAASCARGGYKLDYAVGGVREIVLPGAGSLLLLLIGEALDAVAHRSGVVETQIGEASDKVVQLFLKLSLGDALGSELLSVLICDIHLDRLY